LGGIGGCLRADSSALLHSGFTREFDLRTPSLILGPTGVSPLCMAGALEERQRGSCVP
jgi:hypothetical protein